MGRESMRPQLVEVATGCVSHHLCNNEPDSAFIGTVSHHMCSNDGRNPFTPAATMTDSEVIHRFTSGSRLGCPHALRITGMTAADPWFDSRHPFSRADARAAGLPLSELLSRRYHKLLYDCYVSASVKITQELRAEAAVKASGPGAYVSHSTAALLWGAIVPDTPYLHVSVPRQEHRCRRQGVKAHVSEGKPPPVRHKGVPVSSPAQTFLDLAEAGLTLVQLVVLGDSLVKAERLEPSDLIAAAEAYGGKGGKLARRAARFVRAGVDSAMESRLRMLLVLAGLPEPSVNFIVRHADGRIWMRFDLYYEAYALLVEYDGRQHAEDSKQWLHDIARREQLDKMRLRLLIITKDDFYDAPERVLTRVRDVLIERGATGIRRTFLPEWRAHFSGRS